MLDTYPLPRTNAAVTEFLEGRRSNLARNMGEPGPDADTLRAILQTAARVPDHRKLAPWRFVVIRGEARERLGDVLAERYATREPDALPERVEAEGQKPLRAPVIIGVVSTLKPCRKNTPEWEQVLSAGAVCLKLCMAAQARGFAAQWLTEWYAYDEEVGAHIGLAEGERMAGYIYLGTTDVASKPRPRPDIAGLVTEL